MSQWPFRRWLATEMERSGVSVRELGRRSGIDHSSVSRILAGDREPLLGTVQRLAAVFNAQYVPRRTVPVELSPVLNRRDWSDDRLDVIFVAVVNYGIEAAAKLLGLSPHTVNHASVEFRARWGASSNPHAVMLTWERLGHRYVLGSSIDARPANWHQE